MKLVALVLVASTFLAGPVRADSSAVTHYRQGQAFLDQRAYASAISEFQAAYAIDHHAGHLYNIARAYDLAGDPRNALDYYQRFLAAEPTSPRAGDARAAIAVASRAIEKREPQVAARVVEPARPPIGARDRPSRRRLSPAWLVAAGALIAAGIALDAFPATSHNHRLDAADFAPPTLYGLGATAIVVGVF